MKEFIVYQQVMIKQEMSGNTNNIFWDTVIRLVKAKTQEEAIGKFVVNTSDVQCIQKLTIFCIELPMLKVVE